MQTILRIACTLLLCSITISCFFSFSELVYAAIPEIISYDLIIKGNEVNTQFVNKTVIMNGNIIIEENATLYLDHTAIFFNQTGSVKYQLTLRKPVDGRPRLLAVNSSITSQGLTAVPIYSMGGLVSLVDTVITSSTQYPLTVANSGFLNVSGTKSEMPNMIVKNSSQILLSNILKPILKLNISMSTAVLSNIEVTTLYANRNSNVTLLRSEMAGEGAELSISDSFVNVTGSVVKDMIVINSTAFVTDSTVTGEPPMSQGLKSLGTTNLTIKYCQPTLTSKATLTSVTAYNETNISVSNSEMITFALYNTSTAMLSKVRVVSPRSFVFIGGRSKANISDSEIAYFTASENATVSIANSTLSQTIVRKNSFIFMSKVILLEWLRTYDNTVTSITKARMYQVLDTSGSSNTSISDSDLNMVSTYDSSLLSVNASSITLLHLADSSNVTISDSQVSELQIEARSIIGSFKGFNQASLTYWNLVQNNTIQLHPSDSYIPDLTLRNMQSPRNLSLTLYGASNVTILNTRLKHIGTIGNSIVRLENSSMETYEIKGGSKIYTYWYMAIHVLNSQKAPVVGANVAIIHPNGTIVDSGITNPDGQFVSNKLLEASVLNATGAQRSLILEVLKDDYFARRFAAEFTSENIAIELPIPAPWWQQYWYALVILIALVAVVASIVAFRRFRKKP
jgi:hypothetical protein